ncbi:hypothetical protein BXY39_1517 [Eilatimonas milleporae]|uniref:Uncharacterized protein n=1 Tax=Eilatimonas milleporae TaxID=911205 RepID=A0A3M0CGY2_9PROT|nr:hypothetical protein BXY39_1517 [Eilatimonas milleporae]
MFYKAGPVCNPTSRFCLPLFGDAARRRLMEKPIGLHQSSRLKFQTEIDRTAVDRASVEFVLTIPDIA